MYWGMEIGRRAQEPGPGPGPSREVTHPGVVWQGLRHCASPLQAGLGQASHLGEGF